MFEVKDKMLRAQIPLYGGVPGRAGWLQCVSVTTKWFDAPQPPRLTFTNGHPSIEWNGSVFYAISD